MPLSRYKIKNEYALADPELYRAADKDDPEAILEGVAMAGLVGLLRQLGDLAEFAAEIFHGLHEEVMATAARGHGLLDRVQQLEAEIPSIERTLLSQTNHSSLLYNSGDDWHPNPRMERNLITRGDLPRFIMDSYEECRGPPRLFLLDKFDVAGAGACLKRYTDPSYFEVDGLENSENHMENKTRKAKKKGSLWKNGETPQALPKGQTRLHDLLQEERVQNHVHVPAPHVKLKRRLSEFPCNLKSGGRSYMEKFLKINSTELDVVRETSVSFTPLVPCNGGSLSSIEEVDVNTVSREELSPKRSSVSSSEINVTLPKPSIDQLTEEANYELLGVTMDSSSETYEIFSPLQQVEEKEIEVHRERKMEGSTDNSFRSDDITSDVDNYMDALAIIDSDIESDIEYRDNSYKYLHHVEDLSKQQENLSDLPDSGPVGSFSSLTDNGNLSSSGELSELSAEGIESSDYGRLEDSHRLSEQTLHGLESIPTQPLERTCNDILVIGEEQQQTSSSRRADSYPLTLSLDLEGSLEGDASEHSESSEVCSITNNELLVPSDDAQNFLPTSSSESQLDEQDHAVTLPIIGKPVQSESNKYAVVTENSTEGDNSGDAVDSYNDKIFLDVSPSKDSVDTITGELDIHVKDSCDSQIDPFHFSFLRIDEQPESVVEQGEKQLDFSVLHEEDSEEKPHMLVSHAEEQHQFVVSHSEEESQLLELSYTKEDQNQLVVSNKEDQPQLVVVDIEMQRKPFVTQAEEQPQLTSSHEEQSQSAPAQAEEEQPQLTSSHEEQSQCTPAQAEEEQLQLITSSTEPSQKSLDVISPVELCLEMMDNLEVDRVSEADDGEYVSVSSDVLCDEATNTEQSKAKVAVSVACDKDDVYLSMNFVEDSQPVGESIPSSYFLVKPLESPNNMDQEEVGVPSISRFPSFGLPGPSHPMFDEMPPLPPLPPVQWRIPKIQHALSPLDHIDPAMMSSQLDHEIRIPRPFLTFSPLKGDSSHHEYNLSSVSTFSSIKDPPISDEAHLNPVPKILQEKPIEHLNGLAPETSSENENSSLALTTMETKEVDHLHDMNEEKPPPSVSYSSSMYAHLSEVENERLNGGLLKKLPRPRNPLIDAVVALDKTKLRKVTDRITPPIGKKRDERDSFLEEIRSKSFNLRPTAGARPSIQGPKTNLRVAAILEKANSIRQAHAGSDDDDDDDDGWSDS